MKATADQEALDIPNGGLTEFKEKIDMKFVDDDRYFCIFYPDLACPVQKRLKEFSLIDSLEPLKTDDNSAIAKAMKSVMTASTFTLQCLASFCSSCPHMRKKTYETTAAIRNYETQSVGPASTRSCKISTNRSLQG